MSPVGVSCKVHTLKKKVSFPSLRVIALCKFLCFSRRTQTKLKSCGKSTCFHYKLFDPLQAFEVPAQGMTQRDKLGQGPWRGLTGKKQGWFNSKHIKTFQSSPSHVNISCSLQIFLWSQKPQLGTSSEGRCFFSVLVFSYPPFSRHKKSSHLMCSPEPSRQCEIQPCAIRNTLRAQIWTALFHTFCGCLIVTFMSASEWGPTQVSFREWNHADLSYFIFSVFGQQCGISNREKMSLLYQHRANSAFLQSTWKDLKNKVTIEKG